METVFHTAADINTSAILWAIGEITSPGIQGNLGIYKQGGLPRIDWAFNVTHFVTITKTENGPNTHIIDATESQFLTALLSSTAIDAIGYNNPLTFALVVRETFRPAKEQPLPKVAEYKEMHHTHIPRHL